MRRALVMVAWAVVAQACSSSTEPTATPDGGAPAVSGPVSLRKDVIPILESSCAKTACHGNKENNLGIHLIVSDPAAVHAALQGTSPTANGVKLVVPGDATKSFFFAKIEGTQADFADNCLVPGCGETMPPGSKLGTRERATIRAWIDQGAKND
jgi:hypothetical protein